MGSLYRVLVTPVCDIVLDVLAVSFSHEKDPKPLVRPGEVAAYGGTSVVQLRLGHSALFLSPHRKLVSSRTSADLMIATVVRSSSVVACSMMYLYVPGSPFPPSLRFQKVIRFPFFSQKVAPKHETMRGRATDCGHRGGQDVSCDKHPAPFLSKPCDGKFPGCMPSPVRPE